MSRIYVNIDSFISVYDSDLSERPAIFRQRMNELPAEVAAFLDHLQRLEAVLPQSF
jgi:hypothetical protein